MESKKEIQRNQNLPPSAVASIIRTESGRAVLGGNLTQELKRLKNSHATRQMDYANHRLLKFECTLFKKYHG